MKVNLENEDAALILHKDLSVTLVIPEIEETQSYEFISPTTVIVALGAMWKQRSSKLLKLIESFLKENLSEDR